MMKRKQNFQPIAWFYDLHQRDRLDMDPPYQRRSVWNQAFKDYFIDTILLSYPAPAIFLYEEITPEGVASYHVVDGKQRLTAIFEFVDNVFPVLDKGERTELRGKYFKDLDDDTKKTFWLYQFSVEYLPTAQESIINNIFDRINRNTARLTPQELRHAQYGGEFITAAEDLSDWMFLMMPPYFPNITPRSRKQMKDVEFVAHVLLLLETGPKGYSTTQIDQAFSDRDSEWEKREEIIERFRAVVGKVNEILAMPDQGQELIRSRLKNQADCYSFFGAVDQLLREGIIPDPSTAASRLITFIERVESEGARAGAGEVADYYEAARSASNDGGPRQKRTNIVRRVLTGEFGN
jgi:hypothetical protein